MKKIWAPWRIEYILQSKDPGCFLCTMFHAAPDADREHLLLKRGETCAMLMNRYPYNNGHLMVAPYRHVEKLQQMDPRERSEMMDLVALGMDTLTETMSPDGFNVGINLGEAAGAGLKDHIHVHIVPRWSGDTNFMPVLGDTKVLPQSLDETWELLHNSLQADATRTKP
jgi:ATP adenylyltransferase